MHVNQVVVFATSDVSETTSEWSVKEIINQSYAEYVAPLTSSAGETVRDASVPQLEVQVLSVNAPLAVLIPAAISYWMGDSQKDFGCHRFARFGCYVVFTESTTQSDLLKRGDVCYAINRLQMPVLVLHHPHQANAPSQKQEGAEAQPSRRLTAAETFLFHQQRDGESLSSALSRVLWNPLIEHATRCHRLEGQEAEGGDPPTLPTRLVALEMDELADDQPSSWRPTVRSLVESVQKRLHERSQRSVLLWSCRGYPLTVDELGEGRAGAESCPQLMLPSPINNPLKQLQDRAQCFTIEKDGGVTVSDGKEAETAALLACHPSLVAETTAYQCYESAMLLRYVLYFSPSPCAVLLLGSVSRSALSIHQALGTHHPTPFSFDGTVATPLTLPSLLAQQYALEHAHLCLPAPCATVFVWERSDGQHPHGSWRRGLLSDGAQSSEQPIPAVVAPLLPWVPQAHDVTLSLSSEAEVEEGSEAVEKLLAPHLL